MRNDLPISSLSRRTAIGCIGSKVLPDADPELDEHKSEAWKQGLCEGRASAGAVETDVCPGQPFFGKGPCELSLFLQTKEKLGLGQQEREHCSALVSS